MPAKPQSETIRFRCPLPTTIYLNFDITKATIMLGRGFYKQQVQAAQRHGCSLEATLLWESS